MQRIILHVKAGHLKLVDDYVENMKKYRPFARKLNVEGYGEYTRRVLIARLQNRTLRDIATENGVSTERIRQIFGRFQRYCLKHKIDLKRTLMESLLTCRYTVDSKGVARET